MDKKRILAYSIHYSREGARSHLEKIARFHSLKGRIVESEKIERRLEREIKRFFGKNEQRFFKNEDLKMYRYWKVYHILANSERRLYTYSEISKKTGYSLFQVIKALVHNPFIILIPCHRVVRKDGKISGYTPLGEEFKKEILKREGLL